MEGEESVGSSEARCGCQSQFVTTVEGIPPSSITIALESSARVFKWRRRMADVRASSIFVRWFALMAGSAG